MEYHEQDGKELADAMHLQQSKHVLIQLFQGVDWPNPRIGAMTNASSKASELIPTEKY